MAKILDLVTCMKHTFRLQMDLAFVEIHFLQFFCKSRVVLFQRQTEYDTVYY